MIVLCTSISYKTKDHYFGQNLDLDYSYHETVTITPRNKSFKLTHLNTIKQHLAMIGMAFVVDGYPLYYDATNEKGLSIAGLNFPDNAHYNESIEGKYNVGSFEFIPWILSTCSTVQQARKLLENVNITTDSFSEDLPPSPLHWMISDRKETIVFEQTAQGGTIYDNPVGVLTNNPTFDYHLEHLTDYMMCSSYPPQNNFSKELDLKPHCSGMGAIGLPGDLSSASRFVKAAFTKLNALSGDSESESVTQFFKILHSVEQQKGANRTKQDNESQWQSEYTIYTSCCNTDRGIYYYTTYNNSQISYIDMHQEDLDGTEVVSYDLIMTQQFHHQQ